MGTEAPRPHAGHPAAGSSLTLPGFAQVRFKRQQPAIILADTVAADHTEDTAVMKEIAVSGCIVGFWVAVIAGN